MKKTIYPLLILSILGIISITGLPSCRKDRIQPNIKQYDSIQIVNYIAANGLTGFKRDTTGGDTSGIYYKILVPGSGAPIQYSDKLPFVYTERTLDGTFELTDTIANHFYDFVGNIQQDTYPLGLQTAIHNLMVYPNASMRVLIPSHLAYGVAGKGSGSSEVANNKIAGNECMDFYVHGVNNFRAYDDMVIQNYMKANNLTGYTKVKSNFGMVNGVPDTGNYYYYKILISSANTDPIGTFSTITATYTGQLFDANIFDGTHNGTNTFTTTISGLISGVQEGLTNYAVAGTEISLLLPSSLGYGIPPNNGLPPFSCLRFTWDIISVTP